MAEAIRYFMDQHFPAAASRGLQHHGIDVLTAQAANRCGFSDLDQLAFATSEQRVVVTFDTDYLVLHSSGMVHAGIAWTWEQKYSVGQLIQMLLLLHGVADRDSMQNCVEYL